MSFSVQKNRTSGIRRGELKTAHGVIQTPFFMPVATKGALKALLPSECRDAGAQILLSNTYHLYLRPGHEVIRNAGGLHEFMQWSGPILTDSGGYQVFSLGERLRKNDSKESSRVSIAEDGVKFRSHIDGSEHMLSPERSIAIQQALGSDIMMCFDECPPHDASKEYHQQSMDRTTRWAKRCFEQHVQRKVDHEKVLPNTSQLLFGIVQGGLFEDLRRQHAHDIISIGFDGYAIGGLAVGESNSDMYRVLEAIVPELPENQPRYLMGVGKPENILEAVRCGVDMFDCVLPTRNARHGTLYVGGSVTQNCSHIDYDIVHIQNEQYKEDYSVLDSTCDCVTCRSGFTKAYLRHLFIAAEPIALRLATYHNIAFYMRLFRALRSEYYNTTPQSV